MTDTYAVQLSDRMIADLLWDAAAAAALQGRVFEPRAVMAIAVAAGRRLGAQQILEPLDDAMRGAARSARDELLGRGMIGLTDTLSRLNSFLERYPARGRPDLPGFTSPTTSNLEGSEA
jgi:hypothetical protein